LLVGYVFHMYVIFSVILNRMTSLFSILQWLLPLILCYPLSVACLSKIYIQVCDKLTSNEYLWTKAKFLNRQSYMQEMYGTFEHTGSVPDVPQVTKALMPSMAHL